MTAKEAVERIQELLNIKFGKKVEFASTKLTDGTEITNNLEDEFSIGQELFIVGESTLTPAPAGSHTTREGLIITVDSSSVIIAIETEKKDEMAKDYKMTEAIDAQGQKLESPTFDVGEDVYLIKEDGTKEPAPNGEHQVVLKDESGNENKIRIQVKDGKITQRENVEEMSSKFADEELISKIVEAITPVINEVAGMKEEMKKMYEKMECDYSALKEDFSSFKKQPQRFSVNEVKKDFKENIQDYRLNIIKGVLNNKK